MQIARALPNQQFLQEEKGSFAYRILLFLNLNKLLLYILIKINNPRQNFRGITIITGGNKNNKTNKQKNKTKSKSKTKKQRKTINKNKGNKKQNKKTRKNKK